MTRAMEEIKILHVLLDSTPSSAKLDALEHLGAHLDMDNTRDGFPIACAMTALQPYF
jgi:hypothetical protein